MIRMINSYTGEVKETVSEAPQEAQIRTMKRVLKDEDKLIREHYETDEHISIRIESNNEFMLQQMEKYVMRMRPTIAAEIGYKLV